MHSFMRWITGAVPSFSPEEGQDLLAKPKLWRRLVVGIFVALAGAPFLPMTWIAAWIAGWLLVIYGEQVIARRGGYIASGPPGWLVSFGLSAMQAGAAWLLIRDGDGSARFFAVTLIGFSSVNILLRFYAAPIMLLATLIPHAAVLGWVAWGIFLAEVSQGHLLRALTPLFTLALYVVVIWPARSHLMDAWLRLVHAKAEAQEGRRVAEDANRAKSEFLATMSHEIRTPLNGILGMAQALEADNPSAEQRPPLRVIRQCGRTLLTILNDILDLSKVEAGQMTLEREEFDLEHAARGAVATFRPLAEKKGLTFAFSIAREAKGVFRGDPVRLRQILYNLVSNALKFTDRGAIGVTVGCADERIVIEVADSGVGIPAGKLGDVFEKFVQADASRTRAAGGTGLGLAICRQLVDLMGGTIGVSSREGRGSIFTVTLPLERLAAPRSAASAPHACAPAAAEEAAPLRILAAEDNEVNRLVLTTLLSQANVELTVVENGLEAVRAWRSGAWDVILMDVQMPVMDGVVATREIRAAEGAAGARRTPIIAVTANAMADQCAEYAAAGMDVVVPKPIDIDRLFAAIESALEAAPVQAA